MIWMHLCVCVCRRLVIIYYNQWSLSLYFLLYIPPTFMLWVSYKVTNYPWKKKLITQIWSFFINIHGIFSSLLYVIQSYPGALQYHQYCRSQEHCEILHHFFLSVKTVYKPLGIFPYLQDVPAHKQEIVQHITPCESADFSTSVFALSKQNRHKMLIGELVGRSQAGCFLGSQSWCFG